MVHPIFYAPPESINSDSVTLSKDESHHARSVLRLKENEQVIVIDGKGNAYRGLLGSVRGRKEITVSIHNTIRNFGEPFVKVTLAAGLSEGFKFDSVVQKGTELGVCKFIPLSTEKSRVKIENQQKAVTRKRRLERVALSAVKQCRRSLCPEILPITKYTDFIETTEKNSLNLIFHTKCNSKSFSLNEKPADIKNVTILIGPESGFSEHEMTRAESAGFQIVSMGPRILRTENAAPVACALVMNWLGELS